MADAVIIYTTGVAGSGKTYARCSRFLCDELLPYSKTKVITNYPFYPDKIADFCVERHGMDRQAVLDRLESIPEDELERWRLEESGPWKYFKDRDISGYHIPIDEIHNFCGKHQSKEHRRNWQLWLGEIRHRSATVEFLTQNPQKVAKELDYECGVRYRIENCEAIRDPILGVRCSDWYELRAAFLTGKYIATVHQLESVNIDGRWVQTHQKNYVLDPKYFEFYNSYSRPVAGGEKGKAELRDFQKYGKSGVVFHVFRRNGWPLGWRLCVGLLLCWLCFFGGFSTVMRSVQERIKSFWMAKHPVPALAEPSTVNKPVAGPVVQKPGGSGVSVASKVAESVAGVSSVSSVSPIGAGPSIVLPVSFSGVGVAGTNRVQPLGVPSAALASVVAAVKAERVPVTCVAAWDGGAAFDELGSLIVGEVVNGFRLEKCVPRGAWINGVYLRVGVQTWLDAPAGYRHRGEGAPGVGQVGIAARGSELQQKSVERAR